MKKTIKLIKKAKKIALFSHENPDPDTIGSTLALRDILLKMGKEVHLFCESKISENYYFLEDAKLYEENLKEYDCLISVDVASEKMLGKYQDNFLNAENTIRIDHHIKGDNFAKHNIVKPYSACAILIFELAKLLKIKINSEIATKLFFAICGDTGIFRNNNTDSMTFEVVSKLLENGAEIRKVYSEFFDKKTVSYVKMSSHCLEGAITNDEFGYALLIAKKEDYEKYGVDSENDNLGNLPNSYLSCGYKIAVILKEKDDGIHCSLRSKFEFDVSKIAQNFGGGGHKNASGCSIIDSVENATMKMEDAIRVYLSEFTSENKNN